MRSFATVGRPRFCLAPGRNHGLWQVLCCPPRPFCFFAQGRCRADVVHLACYYALCNTRHCGLHFRRPDRSTQGGG